ncbi:hypothetical protein ACIBH1_22755 [Nonomuraea sp. NPDC050663]|uniref:hypothetical protein n=1 Tax=Nonomuraea sp. NPDC050663 TaxID=3364370 RepID=UPI00378AF295
MPREPIACGAGFGHATADRSRPGPRRRSRADAPDAFSEGWTTKGDGRGLGLALVGPAVRRLNGTVEVTGSTFTVRVPYPG